MPINPSLRRAKKQEVHFPSDFPVDRLSPGERIVFHSACERNGVFAGERICIMTDERGMILSDGTAWYCLGAPCVSLSVQDFSVRKVLARRTQASLIPMSWHSMDKDLAFFRGSPDSFELPEGLRLAPVRSDDERRHFITLSCDFLEEESGARPLHHDVASNLDRTLAHIKPVLLKRGREALGMVSSHFHFADGAIINMMLIARGNRGQGFGEALLRSYVHLLLRHSRCVSLFYSPSNQLAARLYARTGFEKTEEWIMGARSYIA